MEFKQLFDGTRIPVLGFGTWRIGGELSVDKNQDREAVEAIRTAIELGMTHIDTAEMYGLGHSEELVGEAIRGFDRKSLFIATKVSPENLRYDNVINSAKASLRRLGTDYIDLYMPHFPNDNIPMEETMRALDYLVEQGLVRHIGLSNHNVEEIKEAQRYTRNKIVANQIEYNLMTRNTGKYMTNMEMEIIPYCQENNIMVTAWRPLAKGPLARPGIAILDEIAEKYRKTQAQVAINWLISKKNVITVPKTIKLDHLRDNLGAIGWRLSPEDIQKLDREFKTSAY
jgi:diketogulonate reductase-like aldo/keto reductase